MPYINASIIMQILTIAWPKLEELQKEGPAGQKKIRLYTRWLTGALAFLQAMGTISTLRAYGAVHVSGMQQLSMAITLVAGTAFLMWLGEQISDRGIGNGVSIVIFTGIVAFLPSQIVQTLQVVNQRQDWFAGILLLVLFIATVMFIVAITQAQRKIPIQHVKKIVGNKMVGGSSSFLPLKVNSAGVIPIIFAVSIQMAPQTLATWVTHGDQAHWFTIFAYMFAHGGSWWGSLIYALMIIFFTYFYTAVTFNVKDVADNLKKWGSFIPGIRPGKPTQDYLDRILTRVTLAGALFLAIIALTQYWVPELTGLTSFTLVGGTSLLIVVGVAIESHLLMRHYEGFIK